MATIFADAGAEVVISSRHEDDLRTAAAEIREQTAAQTEYVVADMTRREDVRRLAAACLDLKGKIDILVNNAGANLPQAIDQIRDDDWDRLVELNLTSCMVLTRALVPGMKQRRWGRIIHISSIMGLASTAGRNVYSATKSALLGLARATALDLGAFNITVNCIAPGPFATSMPMTILSAGATGRISRPHGPGPLGSARRIGGSGLAAGKRGGQLYHGNRAGGGRRSAG